MLPLPSAVIRTGWAGGDIRGPIRCHHCGTLATAPSAVSCSTPTLTQPQVCVMS